jgi:hypothetical protein
LYDSFAFVAAIAHVASVKYAIFKIGVVLVPVVTHVVSRYPLNELVDTLIHSPRFAVCGEVAPEQSGVMKREEVKLPEPRQESGDRRSRKRRERRREREGCSGPSPPARKIILSAREALL